MMIYIFVIALLIQIVLTEQCVYHFNSPDPSYPLTADFDIRALERKGTGSRGFYEVADLAPDRVDKYLFNFCRNILELPAVGCNTSALYTPRPAFQTGENGACYYLGEDVSRVNVTLIDNHDPSLGLSLTYYNGTDRYCTSQRKLIINLYCKVGTQLPDAAPVSEAERCTYSMNLFSQRACPTTCGIVDNMLCAENGICGFDTDTRTVHCMCNDGFKGKYCAEIGNENGKLSTASIVLIILAVFLAVVQIVVIVVWWKIKGLRLDPTVYQPMINNQPISDAQYQQA